MAGARPTDQVGLLLERDAALLRLEGALEQARSANGALTVIEGPAGTGKTSLLDRVRDTALAEGMRVFSATGNELERTFAFGVAIQLFAEPAWRSRDGRETLGGAAELALPLLEGATPPPTNDPTPSFPLMHGLYWLLVDLAERSPVLIALDDTHWVDPLSLRFLAYLAARLEELPVALLLTVRAGEKLDREAGELLGGLRANPICETIAVEGLGAESTEELVRHSLPDADPALCGAFHEATGGNPFLLNELLSAALEEGTISREAVGTLRPDSVRTSILLRLGRLGDDARRIAGAVAILGPTATLPVAAQLAGLDRARAVAAIDALTAAHILAAAERLRFRHAIVREAVYADIPDAQRRHDHAAAARALQSSGASAEEVASQIIEAEQIGEDWAVPTLRAAAATAAGRGDPSTAVALLRRALEEPGDPDSALLLELGRAEVALADPVGLSHLEEARDCAIDPLQRAMALAGLGQALYIAGDPKGAFEAVEAALAQVPPGHGGPPEAELLCYSMSSGRLLPELVDNAVDLLERPRDIEGAATPAEIARRAVRAFDFVMRGNRERVAEELAWMAEHGEDPGLQRSLPTIVGAAQGLALWQLGRYRESEVIADRMIEDARRRASPLDLAVCLEGRIGVNWGRGDVNACIADAETVLDLSQDGWGVATVATRSILAEMALERCDPAAAEVALAPTAAVEARLEGSHGWFWLPYARAQLAFHSGDWQEALARFLEAGERLLAIQAPSPDYMPWRSLAARSAAQLGERDRADELVEEELELARSNGSRRATGVALAAAGAIRGGDEGVELLREAVEQLDGTEAELAPARARAELGFALRLARRPRDARLPLEEAIDTARRLGALRLADRALDELHAAGGRPRRAAISGVESLTPSQRRVAEMAARGMSNREIAESLFITRRTVETHLTQVYGKLEIASREELPDALAPDATG
jgi:DNA-binding CsgD family transcriptional regulator